MFTDESLVSSEFDEAGYLRHALQVSSTSFETEQLRLSRCLEKIETEIHSTVQHNRDSLIGSVQEVGQAQRTTNAVLTAVDSLSSSVRRMRHTIHEPYLLMEQRLNELKNVHACLSLVRNVQRYLNVATKLKEAADGGDLVRAARLLREVEEMQSQNDFTGVPFVDSITPSVNQAANHIRARLSEALRSAITNLNPGELAVSLHCAASMGTLSKTAQGLLAELKREASRALVKELDNASAFGSEMDASFREAVFGALDKALSQVAVQLRAFGLLWTVLRRRKDPAAETAYWLQLPSSDRRGFESLWTAVINQIKERLSKLAKRGAVLVAVASEYGRLTALLRGFLNSVRELLLHIYFDGEDVIVDEHQLQSGVIDDLVTKLGSDFEPRFKLSLQDRLRERMSGILGKLSTMRPPAGVAENTFIDVKADIRLQQQHSSSSSSSSQSHSSSSSSSSSISAATASAARNAPAMVVHPVASPIDPKNFFKCVANEVANSRNDDSVLAIVLKSICDEIDTFTRKSQESLKQMPVQELPKISHTGNTTALQLFHIQLANAASTFVLEMQSLAAMLPPISVFSSSSSSSSSTSSSATAAASGSITRNNNSNSSSSSSIMTSLERSITQFHNLIETLLRFTSQIVTPYFNAATVVLLQCIDNFVQDYYERGISRSSHNMVGSAIGTRINDFASRYALLFDARAGTVAARACYVLADKMLQRFAVKMLLRRGVNYVQNPVACKLVADDVVALQDAVNVLHPLDRLAKRSSQLRALRSIALVGTSNNNNNKSSTSKKAGSGDSTSTSTKQEESEKEKQMDETFSSYISARFHPVVILLSALQQIPPAAAPSLNGQLKITTQQLVTMLETLLSTSPPLLDLQQQQQKEKELKGSNKHQDPNNNQEHQHQHNANSSWDSGKWTVLWEACNAIVGEVERSSSTATTTTTSSGEEPLCSVVTMKRCRRILDELRAI